MTVMSPPPSPAPKKRKVTLLDLQLQSEQHLEHLNIKKGVVKAQFGTVPEHLIYEIKCQELICEILYTVSMDKERYRRFAIDIRQTAGRWTNPYAEQEQMDAEMAARAAETSGGDADE